MNETAAAWVRGLPMRWALGGLVLALVWAALSIALQGGFATTPVGGYAYALLRIISLIVLPLCALAFVWGLSERGHLERSAAQSTARLQRAIKKYTARQTGKSFYCGVAFTLFTSEISRSFHQWNSADNISADISSVVGGAMLAIPIGILVGVFSRRALKRRLEGQPSDGDADHSARSATRLANMRHLAICFAHWLRLVGLAGFDRQFRR